MRWVNCNRKSFLINPCVLLKGSTDIPWVVAAAEKSKYDAMFKTADKDNDNLVTGIRIFFDSNA